MGGGRYYFNTGTWIRLLRFDDAMLGDAAAFKDVYKVLTDGHDAGDRQRIVRRQAVRPRSDQCGLHQGGRPGHGRRTGPRDRGWNSTRAGRRAVPEVLTWWRSRTSSSSSLRPGPAHNQLLSPLTPYLALCGADGPVTVNMPFEHRQLAEPASNACATVRPPGRSRHNSAKPKSARWVRRLGACWRRCRRCCLRSAMRGPRAARLVHLQAVAVRVRAGPGAVRVRHCAGWVPAVGLSAVSAIALADHASPARSAAAAHCRLDWNRPPRILFAFASPGDLPAVPAQDHLRALRRAIDPWVKFAPTPEERIAHVKGVLTILEGATLEKIREACAATEFTHVHILAHGAPFDQAGHQQYGLALLNESTPTQLDIVDGERLGIALTAKDSSGTTRHRPTVVTLATCDSGNVNTVLTPGSIAHQLHATGIPWVIASQFPLWMRASSIAAEVLYSGFLRGDDPRWVLYELRQRLRTDSPNTHDWASIVAYATVPSGFGNEVRAFRDKQTRRKLEVKFDQADAIVTACSGARSQPGAVDVQGKYAELKQLFQSIRDDLAVWRAELGDSALATERAERLGMSAAFGKAHRRPLRTGRQQGRQQESVRGGARLLSRRGRSAAG